MHSWAMTPSEPERKGEVEQLGVVRVEESFREELVSVGEHFRVPHHGAVHER